MAKCVVWDQVVMEETRWMLVAEDDENDRLFIARAIKLADIPVTLVFAHDGPEVFSCLRAEGRFADRPAGLPAVIVLDHSMPMMSGLEVLSHLKQDPEFQIVPVVMHSAQMYPREVVEAYRLGANAFVEKPVGLKRLTQIFKELGIFWGTINISLAKA